MVSNIWVPKVISTKWKGHFLALFHVWVRQPTAAKSCWVFRSRDFFEPSETRPFFCMLSKLSSLIFFILELHPSRLKWWLLPIFMLLCCPSSKWAKKPNSAKISKVLIFLSIKNENNFLLKRLITSSFLKSSGHQGFNQVSTCQRCCRSLRDLFKNTLLNRQR